MEVDSLSSPGVESVVDHLTECLIHYNVLFLEFLPAFFSSEVVFTGWLFFVGYWGRRAGYDAGKR